MKVNYLFLSLLFVVTRSALGSWHKYTHHGSGNLVSGVAVMQSRNTKLFVVGRHGHLWERVYTSSWKWVDHGVPPFLTGFDRLKSMPCVLMDGKLFIVTNDGILVEHVYGTDGRWHWVDHGKPTDENGRILATLDATKCVASQGNNRHRVFVLGRDNRLYQRWWVNGAWNWRSHYFSFHRQIWPGGFDVGFTGTHVYAVGTNGELYRFEMSPNGNQKFDWDHSLGKPDHGSTIIRSLSVNTINGATRVLVVSATNHIHEWRGTGGNPNSFSSGTQPAGVSSYGPQMILSKEFQHTCGRGNTPTNMVMIKTPHTIYAMTIPNFGGFDPPVAIGTNSNSFIDAMPAVLQNPRCPKVFLVTSNKKLVEFYV
ncbi:uncharacterized protein [Clytia hemisphaerica]|uniref:Uncharacterized protein n=1 Tax=Clytia hemisphaerica TaxID=252671 RepID=A0A7M5V5I6_9CNID|eukprot:TCONS_00002104-protein